MTNIPRLKKLMQDHGIAVYRPMQAHINIGRTEDMQSYYTLAAALPEEGDGKKDLEVFNGVLLTSDQIKDMTDDEIILLKKKYGVKPFQYSYPTCSRGCCRDTHQVKADVIEGDQDMFLKATRKNGMLVSAGSLTAPRIPKEVARKNRTEEKLAITTAVAGIAAGIGVFFMVSSWLIAVPLAVALLIGGIAGGVTISHTENDWLRETFPSKGPIDKIASTLEEPAAAVRTAKPRGPSRKTGSVMDHMVRQLSAAFKGGQALNEEQPAPATHVATAAKHDLKL